MKKRLQLMLTALALLLMLCACDKTQSADSSNISSTQEITAGHNTEESIATSELQAKDETIPPADEIANEIISEEVITDAVPEETLPPENIIPEETITTKAANISADKPTSINVHITNTGEKYHNSGCRYLSKSDIIITLDQAVSKGLTPCSVCKPPTK